MIKFIALLPSFHSYGALMYMILRMGFRPYEIIALSWLNLLSLLLSNFVVLSLSKPKGTSDPKFLSGFCQIILPLYLPLRSSWPKKHRHIGKIRPHNLWRVS
jgi:hypothetical protein